MLARLVLIVTTVSGSILYADYAELPDNVPDQSLWLTDGFEGGAGGDWGQRMGQEYFMQSVGEENQHIYLHEIGHTFALDGMLILLPDNVHGSVLTFPLDFYDWTPTGQDSFIMLAGSATEITEFDAWMARDWWRNLKDRYSL